MGVVVYASCALTSVVCAVMLLRGYRNTRARLLLWSALCFACFALNNLLLIVDEQILPARDLSVVRSLPSVLGIALLLYGLIWDVDR